MSPATSVRSTVASHPRLTAALFSATLFLSTVVGTAAAGSSVITPGP